MSLEDRLVSLVQSVGLDIKALKLYIDGRTIVPEPSYLTSGLILNPSFELWDDNVTPSLWNVFWASNSTKSKKLGRTGINALGLSFPSAGGNQRLIQNGFRAEPYQQFYMEAWVRRVSGNPRISLGYSEGVSPNLQPFSADVLKSSETGLITITSAVNVWTKVSWFFSPTDPNSTFVQPFYFLDSLAAGQVDIDDAYCVPVVIPPGSSEPIVSGTMEDHDYCEKYPDGRLVCRGYYVFPANANSTQTFPWTYPIPFVGEVPMTTINASSTVPQNMTYGSYPEELTNCTIQFRRTTNAATRVYFQSDGRWR